MFFFSRKSKSRFSNPGLTEHVNFYRFFRFFICFYLNRRSWSSLNPCWNSWTSPWCYPERGCKITIFCRNSPHGKTSDYRSDAAPKGGPSRGRSRVPFLGGASAPNHRWLKVGIFYLAFRFVVSGLFQASVNHRQIHRYRGTHKLQ